MSTFGGDSWARDAQQRKRRIDDLLLPASPSSAPDSFRRLSNGKFACLVCPHRPVLDSPLMLSMHSKGVRHMAAESRLREKELLKQHELNKRLALSSHDSLPNSDTRIVHCNINEKPLIEQTRMAILEAQSNRMNDFTANKVSCDQKGMANDSSCDSHTSPGVPMENLTAEWQGDVQKRKERELRFTSSGWKRDGHGKWYRDENVEFDSDEDDPNICLS